MESVSLNRNFITAGFGTLAELVAAPGCCGQAVCSGSNPMHVSLSQDTNTYAHCTLYLVGRAVEAKNSEGEPNTQREGEKRGGYSGAKYSSNLVTLPSVH